MPGAAREYSVVGVMQAFSREMDSKTGNNRCFMQRTLGRKQKKGGEVDGKASVQLRQCTPDGVKKRNEPSCAGRLIVCSGMLPGLLSCTRQFLARGTEGGTATKKHNGQGYCEDQHD